MDFVSLLLGVIVTAIAYMFLPLILLLANKNRFPSQKANKIAIWNSVVIGFLFLVATVEFSEGNAAWNAGPAILYYWINKSILTKKHDDHTPETEYNPALGEMSPEQNQTVKHTRPPQISDPNEIPKKCGNFSTPLSDTALIPSNNGNRFCTSCGTSIVKGSKFCHHCGKSLLCDSRPKTKALNIPSIKELGTFTVGLPLLFSGQRTDEVNILSNPYTYAESIIFAEVFIRAEILNHIQSEQIATEFSKNYVDAIVDETLAVVLNAPSFFTEMFYKRTELYDKIFTTSENPVAEIIDLSTHILHKEKDTNTHISVDDKNFKYFGGLLENIAIKTELAAFLQCIYDSSSSMVKNIKIHLAELDKN